MARISKHPIASRRSGVALLIVIAMLALFAMVGLSFAFYAEYESDASRMIRISQSIDAYDLEPEKLMSYAMGQLIFGVDKTKSPNSKMYRFSLAESMYSVPGGTIPFNGIGFSDPATTKFSQVSPTLNEYVGINVPYTYPDMNNAFLARIDKDGKIKARSFYRNGESLRPASLPPITIPQEGDVRNMDSSAGDNIFDAFWMDLDFPVHIAKDGTAYKPLFAFTVIDLDGRVNLSVCGNLNADYVGSNPATSRCGLGVWEINLAQVLSSNKSEITKLFKSGTNPRSRYGSDGKPDNSGNITFPTTQSYGKIDYTGISTSVPTLPAGTKYSQFIPYPATWNDQPGANHPAGFDYHNPGALTDLTADRPLIAYNAEPLLRWRDRGSAWLTSDVFRLMPSNLTPTNPSTMKQELNMVTPRSMALDTAHLAPFFAGGNANTKYQMKPEWGSYPKMTANDNPVQPPPTQQFLGATQGDFSAAGTSRIAAEMRRINLNRTLNNDQDKQQLVQDIFNRLVRVTGALAPSNNAPFSNRDTNNPQYNATRWLAQFAVNIVDFIDADDTMTMFRWNPYYTGNGTDASMADNYDVVFGVEHNRLLINEGFVTVDNDKNDPGLMPASGLEKDKKGTVYRINAWAELFNPMTAQAPSNGQATLSLGPNQPCYRLLMAENPGGISTSPTGLPSTIANDVSNPNKIGVTDWDKSTTVTPPMVKWGDQVVQGTKGSSYYLVGPADDNFLPDKGYTPQWSAQLDLKSAGMTSKQYTANFQGTPIKKTGDLEPMTNVTLVLQKLVNPMLPEQKDPTKAQYNPFVTVDYFIAPKINPSAQQNNNPPPQDPNANPNDFNAKNNKEPSHVMAKYIDTNPPAQNPPDYKQMHSTGRVQPLRGQATSCYYQVSKSNDGEPQSTFSQQNLKSNANGEAQQLDPFLPFFHFDRPLISTAEIFTTTCVSPGQFTQAFGTQNLTSQSALMDSTSLLSRFLETVTVGDRGYNKYLAQINGVNTPMGTGSKHAILIPGKININEIPAKEVLYALFDAQTGNGASSFQQTDVDTFYQDLQTLNRPIAGFSDFTYQGGVISLQNTLFKSDPNNPNNQNAPPFLFGKMIQNSTGKNDYDKIESLRKVMNNITFTSNTFAVWVTVGFFKVDPATNMPQLEIGAASGSNVRHRMFAIVDRSQLVIPDQQPFAQLTGDVSPGSNNAGFTTPSQLGQPVKSQDPLVNVEYSPNLYSGMALTYDKGDPTKEETVMLLDKNTMTTSPFRFKHASGSPVYLGGIRGAQVPLNKDQQNFVLGHPGPQPSFSLRNYSYVVPYFTLID